MSPRRFFSDRAEPARCPFDKLRVPSQSREGQRAPPAQPNFASLVGSRVVVILNEVKDPSEYCWPATRGWILRCAQDDRLGGSAKDQWKTVCIRKGKRADGGNPAP